MAENAPGIWPDPLPADAMALAEALIADSRSVKRLIYSAPVWSSVDAPPEIARFGWECPCCHVVNGPQVTRCDYKPPTGICVQVPSFNTVLCGDEAGQVTREEREEFAQSGIWPYRPQAAANDQANTINGEGDE